MVISWLSSKRKKGSRLVDSVTVTATITGHLSMKVRNKTLLHTAGADQPVSAPPEGSFAAAFLQPPTVGPAAYTTVLPPAGDEGSCAAHQVTAVYTINKMAFVITKVTIGETINKIAFYLTTSTPYKVQYGAGTRAS